MATPSRLGRIRHSRESHFSHRTLRGALFIAVVLARHDLRAGRSEQHVPREPDAATDRRSGVRVCRLRRAPEIAVDPRHDAEEEQAANWEARGQWGAAGRCASLTTREHDLVLERRRWLVLPPPRGDVWSGFAGEVLRELRPCTAARAIVIPRGVRIDARGQGCKVYEQDK
jgi:hypothetical protein